LWRDACRFGIAPCRWEISLAARYPETTRGIAPFKPMVAVSRCAQWEIIRGFSFDGGGVFGSIRAHCDFT
jgi:hypothetical protein